jgi:hypothetical protein
MNDVKYLCERLLDDVPPPLPDGADVLATARRCTARRFAVWAGVPVAVAAVIGAVVLVLTPGNVNDQVAQALAGAEPPAPPVADSAPPEVPFAQAPGTHDRKMFDTIKRALPPGYTATAQDRFSKNPTPYPADPAAPQPSGVYATGGAHVRVLVANDGRVGWLSAYIYNNGRPLPTGDLCGPEIAKQNNEQPGTTCEVIEVDGTKVRMTKEHWDNTAPEIDVIVATRFLRNGALVIVESRSVPDFQSEKELLPPDAVNKRPQKQTPTSALGEWFLTEERLAALIADPAMLP